LRRNLLNLDRWFRRCRSFKRDLFRARKYCAVRVLVGQHHVRRPEARKRALHFGRQVPPVAQHRSGRRAQVGQQRHPFLGIQACARKHRRRDRQRVVGEQAHQRCRGIGEHQRPGTRGPHRLWHGVPDFRQQRDRTGIRRGAPPADQVDQLPPRRLPRQRVAEIGGEHCL
jgi:hypothetical protein